MLQQFLLYCRIARRTCVMLPRRKKSIRLLQLDNQQVEGRDGLILLKYKFTNAIYYSIGSKKIMAQQIIMKKPEEGHEIPFTVFGFSKRNDYILSMAGDDIVLTRLVQKNKVAENRYPTDYAINLA